MTYIPSPLPALNHDRLLLRGIHLDLTDALRASATRKAQQLLRLNDRIIRVRIDLERDATAAVDRQFIAKGHVEIGGPDLLASSASNDLYHAIGLMTDKLVRLLRRRSGRQAANHRGGFGLTRAMRTVAAR